jgi:ABC-type branched-subunit amino acid transport system ATPase component/ABC-type branched-subunit amino acid transport system permease subunit
VITIPGVDFQLPVEMLVLGVIAGMTYGLLGVGLTLVYRTSRVMNFAHGEIGALAPVLVVTLVVMFGLNYWLSAVLGLGASVIAGLILGAVVVGPLAHASRLITMVGTIGASQLFFVADLFIPRPQIGGEAFPAPFNATVSVGNLQLHAGHFMILVATPIAVGALALFLRRSRLGIASRAVSENMEAAQHAGVPTRRVVLTVWAIAGFFAGLALLLQESTTFVQTASAQTAAAIGPPLLFRALAASVIGGFTNIWLTFAGGLGIGVIEAFVGWNYPRGGTTEIVIFALLLAVFFFRRDLGRLVRGAVGSSWSLTGTIAALPPHVARLPRVQMSRWALIGALVAIAAILPTFVDSSHTVLLSSIAIYAIMGLSLVVLTGFTGQISLGQFAFVAVGATVGGRLTTLGLADPLPLLLAALVAGALALVVGIPALRIRGLFLAVPTLGVAVVASLWLFQQTWLTTSGGLSALTITRPEWFGIDFGEEQNFYWICLVALVVIASLVHWMRRNRVGRSLEAVRDNESWAAALGISATRSKLIGFFIAGLIAGLAGYFEGALLVRFDGSYFDATQSLSLVALAIFGGITTVTGAIVGAVWLRASAFFLAPLFPGLVGPYVSLLFGGVGLMGAVIQFPNGVASAVFKLRDRLLRRWLGEGAWAGPPVKASAQRRSMAELVPLVGRGAERPAGDVLLSAEGVSVHFGTIIALEDVTIELRAGEILGLIGPNGAGKTTLLDVLSGETRPQKGRVFLQGRDVGEVAPNLRARLGLGRSFQQGRLFDNLTVMESLRIAADHSATASARGLDDVIEVFGLAEVAHRRAADLPTGTRRIAEMASLIALGSDVLLLDEPSAGIAHREISTLGTVLRDIRDQLGRAVVIIDHDVPLVRAVADRAYGLVAGRVVAEGRVDEVVFQPEFSAAYLGTDERFVHRSDLSRIATSQGGAVTPSPAPA